jgi:MFS transporter, ACS family, solute carrier family 17 (sodium-dependent inorganic phosphate cotransporter), other
MEERVSEHVEGIVGIFQGVRVPSVHTVLLQWVLPHEGAKATSLCTSGMYLGSAAAIQLLPGITKACQDPSPIFCLVALLGAVWLGLCLWLGKDVKHHKSLIPLTSADVNKIGATSNDSSRKQVGKTPLGSIMRHSAVWAIVVNNFAFHYTSYVIMSWFRHIFNP